MLVIIKIVHLRNPQMHNNSSFSTQHARGCQRCWFSLSVLFSLILDARIHTNCLINIYFKNVWRVLYTPQRISFRWFVNLFWVLYVIITNSSHYNLLEKKKHENDIYSFNLHEPSPKRQTQIKFKGVWTSE